MCRDWFFDTVRPPQAEDENLAVLPRQLLDQYAIDVLSSVSVANIRQLLQAALPLPQLWRLILTLS